jgi:hypothetical protein
MRQMIMCTSFISKDMLLKNDDMYMLYVKRIIFNYY